MASGAVDEAASLADRTAAQSTVRLPSWSQDAATYLSREFSPIAGRPRRRAQGLRAIPRDPESGARLRVSGLPAHGAGRPTPRSPLYASWHRPLSAARY